MAKRSKARPNNEHLSVNLFSSSERRGHYEYRVAVGCVIPCLSRWNVKLEDAKVLDLGCGSGGVVVALAEQGAKCLGLDHNNSHIRQARLMALDRGVDVKFVHANALYLEQLGLALESQQFDLIILSEFLEHLVNIRQVAETLSRLKNYLVTTGHIYASFPPWFNPFAGHQAGWPVIRYIPWFHLIPNSLKYVIAPRHAEQYLEFAHELNHLTITSFEKIVEELPLVIIKRELFHLRPEFGVRYGVPTVRSAIGRIPILREITTTGAFYLLRHSENE